MVTTPRTHTLFTPIFAHKNWTIILRTPAGHTVSPIKDICLSPPGHGQFCLGLWGCSVILTGLRVAAGATLKYGPDFWQALVSRLYGAQNWGGPGLLYTIGTKNFPKSKITGWGAFRYPPRTSDPRPCPLTP